MTLSGFEKLIHAWVFQEVPSVFLLTWKPRRDYWVKAAELQLQGPAGGETLASVTLCSPSLQNIPHFPSHLIHGKSGSSVTHFLT